MQKPNIVITPKGCQGNCGAGQSCPPGKAVTTSNGKAK